MATSRKLIKKYFTVTESIFHRQIHVLINYSRLDYAKWVTGMNWEDSETGEEWYDNAVAWSSHVDSTAGPREWIIVLNHFNWTIGDVGTLIHEIVHTIVKIFTLNHIVCSEDTQEFLAHDIGNLYEDIAIKLTKKPKRLKKVKSTR